MRIERAVMEEKCSDVLHRAWPKGSVAGQGSVTALLPASLSSTQQAVFEANAECLGWE